MNTDNRHDRGLVKLFLGVQLSPAAIQGLGETAESMRRTAYESGYQIRWVRPINYHITVAFLGNTRPEVIAAISDRLTPRLAALPGFHFSLTGFGGFPGLDRARVLWAGVNDPTAGLGAVVETCAEELEGLGFARDHREYHPHVTIGRLRKPDDVRPVFQNHSERTFSKSRVDFVVLFESIMKSSGPEYIERVRFGLENAISRPKRQTEPLQPSEMQHRHQGTSGVPGKADAAVSAAPPAKPSE